MLVAVCGLVSVPPSPAEDNEPERDRTISVRDTFKKPETVLGPVRLIFEHVNPLRYELTIARDVDEFDGPDLAHVGLIPKLTGAAEKGERAVEQTTGEAARAIERASAVARATEAATDDGKQAELAPIEQAFEKRLDGFDRLRARVDALLESAETRLATKRAVAEAIRDLVEQSDGYLERGAGPAALVQAAHDLGGRAATALGRRVPSSGASLVDAANELRRLNALTRQAGFETWYATGDNRERFDSLERGLEGLAGSLEPLGKDGELRQAAEALDAALKTWSTVLTHLHEDSFRVKRLQRCDYPFRKRREYTYSLTRVDRLENDAAKAISSMPVAKVVCLPILVPSGGIAVGGVDERDFGFVQAPDGSGGVKSVIGLESAGDSDLAALVLINARVRSFGPQWRHGVYVSAGTQLDLGDSLEGDRIGYALGGSVSLGRLLFLTVGVEANRTRELAGGFSLGDDVPAGLAEPPMTREWDFGHFVGITVAFP